ncbi:hypothetical protein [Pelosinus sp. sgz500959]|uniref:hypothetical protein n=1 Tax=Pelosinus sp. sgz500959 TaxID=3242472 RepID=UPI00366C13E1
MLKQQVSAKNYVEGLGMMREDKTLVVKVDVKKAVYKDLTQTKEFWSNLAVLS